MLIESKIRRQNGTTVTMGDTTYRFTADETGAHHVCEVTDKRHIQRFLAIAEGYRIAGAPDEAPAPRVVAVADDPLAGSGEVDMVDLDDEDEDEDEDGEDEEEDGEDEDDEEDGPSVADIDDLDIDALEARYAARGLRIDRRRSVRTLRSELRAIETGART